MIQKANAEHLQDSLICRRDLQLAICGWRGDSHFESLTKYEEED